VVSNEEGQSHCWINQNAKLALGYFESGQPLTYRFNPVNKGLFLFNISGELQVNDQAVSPREGLGIWDTDQVQFNFLSESKFLLIEVPINH
jgi:redox-sensitive bicupin YhaK (pirin superfamily)